MRTRLRTSTFVAASFLALSVLPIASSSAAVKPGSACTKANATTKISGDKYICTKNPIKNSSKLTWVWETCLTSNTQYQSAVTRLASLKSGLVTAQAALDKLITQIPATEDSAKKFEAKALEARGKQSAATAKATENSDLAKKAGVTTAAGLAYLKNATTWSKNANLYASAASNFENAAKSLRDKIASVDREKAKLESSKSSIARAETDVQDGDKARRQACTL